MQTQASLPTEVVCPSPRFEDIHHDLGAVRRPQETSRVLRDSADDDCGSRHHRASSSHHAPLERVQRHRVERVVFDPPLQVGRQVQQVCTESAARGTVEPGQWVSVPVDRETHHQCSRVDLGPRRTEGVIPLHQGTVAVSLRA